MSKYRIKINGSVYEMEVECIDKEDTAQLSNASSDSVSSASSAKRKNTKSTNVVQIIDSSAKTSTKLDDSKVCSVMPGTIMKIMYTAGEFVKKGQPVLVLEAMKMENEIVAAKNGKISKMCVEAGQTVPGGAVLFEIE